MLKNCKVAISKPTTGSMHRYQSLGSTLTTLEALKYNCPEHVKLLTRLSSLRWVSGPLATHSDGFGTACFIFLGSFARKGAYQELGYKRLALLCAYGSQALCSSASHALMRFKACNNHLPQVLPKSSSAFCGMIMD
ncbi:uncharacterized protein M6G45_009165 isoform 1-T3 [Spheniscus humboldti]